MGESNALKRLLNEKQPENGKAASPKEPDIYQEESWEEPSGDGRTSRHQVLSCQLIKGKQIVGTILYGAILWYEGDFNGTVFKVHVAKGDQVVEITIEGSATELQKVVDKLTSGKRESIRVNGESITAIRIEAVAASE